MLAAVGIKSGLGPGSRMDIVERSVWRAFGPKSLIPQPYKKPKPKTLNLNPQSQGLRARGFDLDVPQPWEVGVRAPGRRGRRGFATVKGGLFCLGFRV